MKIYNVLGEEVRTLVDEQKPAGYHQVNWDGRDEAGEHLASGLYIYHLQAGSFVQNRKMMLLR